MVKKKGGSKKGKKKAKKIKELPPPEPGKEFYEAIITELNRELSKLRVSTLKLERRNEELVQKLKDTDIDRRDVLAYLETVLGTTKNESKEFRDLLNDSLRQRAEANKNHAKTLEEMMEDRKQMMEALTSDTRLLFGKLSALEETRIKRCDLMRNFEIQEQQMEEQETRHKKEIYDIEKKNVIELHDLKQAMEDRLVKLYQEFHDVANIRIAAYTNKVIKKNINVNNQMDAMITEHKKAYASSELINRDHTTFSLQSILHDQEKKKILLKYNKQLKIIQDCSEEIHALEEKIAPLKVVDADAVQLQNNIDVANKRKAKYDTKIRILSQNLHRNHTERMHLQIYFDYCTEDLNRYTLLINQAIDKLTASLIANIKPKTKSKVLAEHRRNLLMNVVNILVRLESEKVKRPSLESTDSIEAVYAIRDNGLVPKPVRVHKEIIEHLSFGTKITTSFEQLVANYLEEQRMARLLLVESEPQELEEEEDKEYEHELVKPVEKPIRKKRRKIIRRMLMGEEWGEEEEYIDVESETDDGETDEEEAAEENIIFLPDVEAILETITNSESYIDNVLEKSRPMEFSELINEEEGE